MLCMFSNDSFVPLAVCNMFKCNCACLYHCFNTLTLISCLLYFVFKYLFNCLYIIEYILNNFNYLFISFLFPRTNLLFLFLFYYFIYFLFLLFFIVYLFYLISRCHVYLVYLLFLYKPPSYASRCKRAPLTIEKTLG